ncbi:hypothetical protein MLD38_028443 [Melastoma candidum]|uniref:Uncharacterized protein n=1 Tax=Melastoma candidum TaxID=119954 RepID=A0ACB9N2D5_9MYRT|nr:hypothetical protein MLD38_028443 [Melastoma candidum]
MKWFSISKPDLRLSLAGLVGVAGVVVVAVKKDSIFLGLSNLLRLSAGGDDKESAREKEWFVPGLQNLGNNCFLNVVLQALASCSSFHPYVGRFNEEYGTLDAEERDEIMPLTVALDKLLVELCGTFERKVVVSPREVMLEMSSYIPNFSLTSQQDAAEAFLHLLFSLREELSEFYAPVLHPLSVEPDWWVRVLHVKHTNHPSEPERWQKHFLGPFDGIIGTILTCRSCASQISFNSEFFHTLLLSPVLSYGLVNAVDCSLEDCLKHFIRAERVTNYHCRHCWHIGAVKYLSITNTSEVDIQKVEGCTQDFCDCSSLFNLERLPWSNEFSYTMKQSSITRSPKILCIQLHRASVDVLGQSVKIQGHVSFPLILDLSPYMNIWDKSINGNVPTQLGKSKYHQGHSCGAPCYVQSDAGGIFYVPKHERPDMIFKASEDQNFECSIDRDTDLSDGESCSTDRRIRYSNKKSEIHLTNQSKGNLYRLISVIQHFGRTGGGHYTVYRAVRSKPCTESCEGNSSEPLTTQWFHISDSQVYHVSESEVLAAEASLLFYEKLENM